MPNSSREVTQIAGQAWLMRGEGKGQLETHSHTARGADKKPLEGKQNPDKP